MLFLGRSNMENRHQNNGNDLLRALDVETEPERYFFRFLVLKTVNLNTISFSGESALHIAVRRNFLDSARVLLEAGASVNIKGTTLDEETPLHVCSGLEHGTEMMRLLLKYGADVNAENYLLTTPLHIAAREQCVENIHELLRNGAAANRSECGGDTPLFCAVMRYSEEITIVQALLSAGADVHHKNEQGESVLHYAAHFSSLQIVRFLLTRNAEVNIKDVFDYIPLHHSAQNLHQPIELIRELLKHGANVNELNLEGKSPLKVALQSYGVKAAQELLRCGAYFKIGECLDFLEICLDLGEPFLNEFGALPQELVKYVFINNPDSLKSIRHQLRQKRVVSQLRCWSSPECNLEDFKRACSTEVKAWSKVSCDCGNSSIWDSITCRHPACSCETSHSILKFLFSGRPSNFRDAFFNKLSKQFLVEVALNLISYFEFKESGKVVMLNLPCVKEMELYVSWEDVVLFLESKQSEMSASEFQKFFAFTKGESPDEISPPPVAQKDRVC